MQPSSRMLPAVAVALFAGALRGAQTTAPQVLISQGVAAGQLSTVLTAANLLVVATSPFGVALAGYVWGTDADVPRLWRSLVGATFAAAAVGFGAAYVLLTALAVLGGGPELGELAVRSLYHLVTVAGLAGVALAALAGAAVAQFRAPNPERATKAGHGAE